MTRVDNTRADELQFILVGLSLLVACMIALLEPLLNVCGEIKPSAQQLGAWYAWDTHTGRGRIQDSRVHLSCAIRSNYG
jgi:hypothetical protein